MGTRAITNIYDDGKLLVTIYRQLDGYLSGHGQDLVDAFEDCISVNGITFSTPIDKQINGMGCAAARLIAYLKSDMEGGNIYINEPDEDASEDFNYELRGNSMKPELGMTLKVSSYGQVLYAGPFNIFDPIKLEEELDADEDLEEDEVEVDESDRIFTRGQWESFNRVLCWINEQDEKYISKGDLYDAVVAMNPISLVDMDSDSE